LPFATPDLDEVWRLRLDRIIEHTHKTYCRERKEVDEEIRQRQDKLREAIERKPRIRQEEDEE
jgi:hypothetical protein